MSDPRTGALSANVTNGSPFYFEDASPPNNPATINFGYGLNLTMGLTQAQKMGFSNRG
jgi:hypothetical protein